MYYKGNLVVRAADKLRREALRMPGVRVLRGYAYHKALEAHSTHLPPLDARDLPLLEQLRKMGAQVVDIEALGLPETPAMFAALDTLVAELKAMPAGNDNAPRLPPTRVMEFPEVYLWGLNERLLNLIENYIGLPIHYHGVDIRREVADGKASDVRQFHLDTEDHRMFRAILYLNDVKAGGGPFEYVSRAQTLRVVNQLDYVSGFVPDATMERIVPRSEWVQATGNRHFGAFADTCRIFHRAQPPREIDRYSITLTWMSTNPIKTYPYTPLSDAANRFIQSRINARQRAALRQS